MKLIDLAGTKFGDWTVVSRAASQAGQTRWLCVCKCGEQRSVSAINLRSGRTTGCGRHRQPKVKHGACGTRAYAIWAGMIQRCNNKSRNSYKNYGGRGITVCERWLSFENFLQDMGHPPEGQSIERKDNDQGYSPENCVWATDTVQARNSRNAKLSQGEVDRIRGSLGTGRRVADLAKEFRVSESLIRAIRDNKAWLATST